MVFSSVHFKDETKATVPMCSNVLLMVQISLVFAIQIIFCFSTLRNIDELISFHMI